LLEYSSLLTVPLFAAYTWRQAGRRDVRRVLPLALFLVPLALQFGYNTLAFGAPTATGYRYTEFAKVMPAGFQAPTLPMIWGVSFSPFRGIFFRSPYLLLAIAGFVAWWRNAKWRAEWWFCLALILLFLLYNMSYQVWWGGFSVGPRHFVSALPFFLPPIAAAWQHLVYNNGRTGPLARPRLAGALIIGLPLVASLVLVIGESWARQGFPKTTPV
jgi:hypothetical protein